MQIHSRNIYSIFEKIQISKVIEETKYKIKDKNMKLIIEALLEDSTK